MSIISGAANMFEVSENVVKMHGAKITFKYVNWSACNLITNI